MTNGSAGVPNGVISVLQTDMADGDSSVDNMLEGGSKTFYTVQNRQDTKRLLENGTPWPNSPSRAHFGEGVYAWGSLEDAEKYMSTLGDKCEDIQIIEFRISNFDFDRINKMDLTIFSDELANEFLAKYSSLFGEGLPHGYDFIRRAAGMTDEYFFSKTIFDLLQFVKR